MDYVVDGRAFRDRIANISEGGAFIETSRKVPPGKPITLSFSLFEEQHPIRVTGEVAWSSGTGIGVKLPSNAGIRQFCADEVEMPRPPHEAALTSLGADEPATESEEEPEEFEEPVPAERPAPVFVTARTTPERVAAEPRPVPVPPRHVTSRRALSVPTALPVWIAISLVAALILIDRSQTNARISALADKVDRTSQTLARLEPKLEAAVSRVGSQAPIDAPRPAEIARTASPVDQAPAAIGPDASQSVAASSTSAVEDTVYVVVEGDTLYRIARKFDVAPTILMERNHLTNPDRVLVGQKLRIPAAQGM